MIVGIYEYTDFYVSRRKSCRGKRGKRRLWLNKNLHTLVRRNQYVFLKNVKNVTRSMRKVVLLLVLAHHNAFNLHYGSRMVRRSERTIMHSNALLYLLWFPAIITAHICSIFSHKKFAKRTCLCLFVGLGKFTFHFHF